MYYLNNTGSRWIIPDGMEFILVLPGGDRKRRKADFYESFGNFASTHYRYKGKRYSGLADYERDEPTGLQVIIHSKWDKEG